MSKKLRDKLKEGAVVFDVDGVLAVYEFGDCCHTTPIWEEAFISRQDNPYVPIKPIPVMQEYVRELGRENAYVCSVSDTFDREPKADFVLRNYDIPAENIFFVASKSEKLDMLRALRERLGDKQIAIVDDTVKTLDDIYLAGGFLTVHVTSFFD